MQEYTIHRSARRCHTGNRPFEPKELYYSVVLQRGSELVRQDFSKQHWSGCPESAVGWWTSQMPAKTTGKLSLAPAHILLDSLERLCEHPEDRELAYVLSLLMVRRRILTDQSDDFSSENATQLQLCHGSSGREFVVPVCQPSPESTEFLQQKLIELLYCES